MNKFVKSVILGTAVVGLGVAPAMAATKTSHKAHAAKVVKAKKAKKAATAPAPAAK